MTNSQRQNSCLLCWTKRNECTNTEIFDIIERSGKQFVFGWTCHQCMSLWRPDNNLGTLDRQVLSTFNYEARSFLEAWGWLIRIARLWSTCDSLPYAGLLLCVTMLWGVEMNLKSSWSLPKHFAYWVISLWLNNNVLSGWNLQHYAQSKDSICTSPCRIISQVHLMASLQL